MDEDIYSEEDATMLSLQDREWHPFPLTKIFTISPGRRLTKSDMKPGIRPFIGATDSNNGITNYVSNINVSIDKDVLGVNYNGSVVETFYHPYECIFSDDVKRFKLKEIRGNRWIYLFLKTAIVQQKSKYAYGYKFNEQRMSKQSIILPRTENYDPDWMFMENYVRERELRIVQEYIEPSSKIIEDCRGGGDWHPLIKKFGNHSHSQIFSY